MSIANSPQQFLSNFAMIADFHELNLLKSQEQSLLPQIVMIKIGRANDQLVIRMPDRNLPFSIISFVDQSKMLFAFQIETIIDAKDFTNIFPTYKTNQSFIVSSNHDVLNYFYRIMPTLIPIFDIRTFPTHPQHLFGELLRTRSMMLMVLPSQITTLDNQAARSKGLRFWVDISSEALRHQEKYINVVYGVYSHSSESLYKPLFDSALKTKSVGISTIAHRGIPVWSPENSLRGIQQAIELKADIVEFDIHTSLDHELIVMHDDTTLRTTGQNYLIRSTKAEIICGLYLLNKNPADLTENVPHFSQTLPLLNEGSTTTFIEIKDANPLTASLIFEQLEKCSYQIPYQVISFNLDQLQRVSDYQQCRVGWLNDVVKEGDSLELALSKICEIVIPLRASYNPYFGPLSPELVDQLHLRGIAVWPWTIDNESDMMNMVNMSVDGITSNNLPLLQSVISRCSHAE